MVPNQAKRLIFKIKSKTKTKNIERQKNASIALAKLPSRKLEEIPKCLHGLENLE